MSAGDQGAKREQNIFEAELISCTISPRTRKVDCCGMMASSESAG